MRLRAEQTTATIAVLQLGTLLAVLIYFAGDIVKITRAFVVDHVALIAGRHRVASADGSDQRLSPDAWLGWLVIIGSIPVAVVGLLFKKQIEGTFTKNLWVIATMMIVIAILLAVAELVAKQKRSMEHLGIFDAVVVGFAQCLALIPGSSRSGSTIMAGLFAGEVRETAARFSFLLSIPAVLASGLLELRESDAHTAARKLWLAGRWHAGVGSGWVCFDLVSVAIPANALDRSLYRLSFDYRQSDSPGVVDGAPFGGGEVSYLPSPSLPDTDLSSPPLSHRIFH